MSNKNELNLSAVLSVSSTPSMFHLWASHQLRLSQTSELFLLPHPFRILGAKYCRFNILYCYTLSHSQSSLASLPFHPRFRFSLCLSFMDILISFTDYDCTRLASYRCIYLFTFWSCQNSITSNNPSISLISPSLLFHSLPSCPSLCMTILYWLGGEIAQGT